MARWGFDQYTMINGLAISMMLAALFKAFDYIRIVPSSSSPILRRPSSYSSHKKQNTSSLQSFFPSVPCMFSSRLVLYTTSSRS